MARKPIGKKLRFEVFKRDCFRCHYCGTTPDVSVLHVDHIVPVSKGGSNDPANLVAACESCNGGKSDRLLGAVSLPPRSIADKDAIAEQAEQMRGYLESLRSLESARHRMAEAMQDLWETRVGPMSNEMATRIQSLLVTTPVQVIQYAIEAVGRSKLAAPYDEYRWSNALRQQKYFSGVLRKLRADREAGGCA